MASFSKLHFDLSLAYQPGNRSGKSDASRYAANAGTEITGERFCNDRTLSLDSLCSNLQTESRYSPVEYKGLALDLEQSDLAFYFDFDQVKTGEKVV